MKARGLLAALCLLGGVAGGEPASAHLDAEASACLPQVP
jgi:hypothetical protein